MNIILLIVVILVAAILYLLYRTLVLNVVVPPNSVGVLKRGNGTGLSRNPDFPGIALNANEVGIIPSVYLPGERIFIFPRQQYEYIVHPMTVVPEGEIGLVFAKYGKSKPQGSLLSISVPCDNFVNAASFFKNGGIKGAQSDYLNEGEYPINLEIFRILTSSNLGAEKGGITATDLKSITLTIEKHEKDGITANDLKTITIEKHENDQTQASSFKPITIEKNEKDGITASDLKPITIKKHQIGIVTTKDGKSLEDQIAGAKTEGHNNFQNATEFLLKGGFKGLQEEILTSGSWTINPLFASVELLPLIEIPNDRVGVLTSSFGKKTESSSEIEAMLEQDQDTISVNYYLEAKKYFEGDDDQKAKQALNSLVKEIYSKKDYEKIRSLLVEDGYKGVLKRTLPTGLHPINTSIYKVDLVPTNQIILEWHDRKGDDTSRWDFELKAIPIFTKDRHQLILEVTQTIRISKDEAPIMILTVGGQDGGNGKTKSAAIRNLVTKVLSRTVTNEFLAAAAAYDGIDFIDETRSEIQAAITTKVNAALKFHGVVGINTTFTVVKLSEQLQKLIDEKNRIDTEKLLAEQEILKIEELKKQEMASQQRLREQEIEQEKILATQEALKNEELKKQEMDSQQRIRAQEIEQEKILAAQEALKNEELKKQEIDSRQRIREQEIEQEKLLATQEALKNEELKKQEIDSNERIRGQEFESNRKLEEKKQALEEAKIISEFKSKLAIAQQNILLEGTSKEFEMQKLANELERDLLKSEKGVKIKQMLIEQKRIESQLELDNFIRKLEAEGGAEAKIMMEFVKNFANAKFVPDISITGQDGNSGYFGNPTGTLVWNLMNIIGDKLGDVASEKKFLIGNSNISPRIGGSKEVSSDYGAILAPVTEVLINVFVDEDFNTFILDDSRLNDLIESLKILLKEDRISFKEISEGSVIVTLEMPKSSAENLYALVKLDLLKGMKIIEVKYKGIEDIKNSSCGDYLDRVFKDIVNYKSCLKKMLTKNQNNEVLFNEIMRVLNPSSKLYNSVILISTRLRMLNDKNRDGGIDYSEYSQQMCSIILSLCGLIDDISQEELNID